MDFMLNRQKPLILANSVFEVPQTAEFIDVSSEYSTDKYSFVTSYRCTSIDLTISSFNKTYLEENYRINTGETIESGKYIIEQLTGNSDLGINETSGNTTIFVEKTLINGQVDTDVAGVYNDDDHLIIIEGGDIDFIKNITYSLKINATFR